MCPHCGYAAIGSSRNYYRYCDSWYQPSSLFSFYAFFNPDHLFYAFCPPSPTLSTNLAASQSITSVSCVMVSCGSFVYLIFQCFPVGSGVGFVVAFLECSLMWVPSVRFVLFVSCMQQYSSYMIWHMLFNKSFVVPLCIFVFICKIT